MLRPLTTLCACFLVAACGSDPVDDPGATSRAERPIPSGEWQSLVDTGWALDGGREGYHCALTTVQQDMWVAAFRALSPEGTHHTVVSISDSTEPDGDFPCDAGRLSDEMIFASGVGTDDLVLPEGVAFKIPKGKRVLLNLHLYNTSGGEITGVSGTQVKVIDAADVKQEAEVIFAGSVLIAVPPLQDGGSTGTCTFNQDATVMSVWPHMHQYGTHMQVTHEASDGEHVLHDGPFHFEEQVNYPIAPQQVKAGEAVRVDCSYENPTSSTLSFGDSSDQEMCFAGLYRYPAEHNGLFCDIPFF